MYIYIYIIIIINDVNHFINSHLYLSKYNEQENIKKHKKQYFSILFILSFFLLCCNETHCVNLFNVITFIDNIFIIKKIFIIILFIKYDFDLYFFSLHNRLINIKIFTKRDLERKKEKKRTLNLLKGKKYVYYNMVSYTCIECNFSTNKTTNYHRHLNTNKHLRNESHNKKKQKKDKEKNIDQGIIVKHIYDDDNSFSINDSETIMQHNATQCNTKKENCFLCKYCNKEFSKHQSYYRHMKHYCKNNKEDNYKDFLSGVVNKLVQSKDDLINCQKENLQLLLEEKDKRIEDNKVFLDINNSIIQNINNGKFGNTYNQTNNTMNNTNYVLNFINYSEADTMDSLKGKFKLTRDEFIKASLTTDYKGALLEKAENIIIKPYLDKRSRRPMQTVDSARKKALFKDDGHDKWTFNPKTTLDHCFKEFHLSALNHQDQTIKENPNFVINSNEDNFYKQTYFIPTETKERESIYRDISNHIYKETKVSRPEKNTINDVIEYLEYNNDD